jgi:hypothetical protein
VVWRSGDAACGCDERNPGNPGDRRDPGDATSDDIPDLV